MSWVLLSLLSAAIWALINVFDKYLISQRLTNWLFFYPFVGAACLLTGLGAPLVVKINFLPPPLALLALLPGALYIFNSYFYFKSVQVEEISRVIPLYYLSAIFTTILAAPLLAETFTAVTYLGIAFLVLGAMLISVRNVRSWKMPKTFWMMLLVALVLSLDILLTKWIVDQSDFWTVWWYGRIGEIIAVIPFTIMIWPQFKKFLATRQRGLFALLFSNDLMDALGLIVFVAAVAAGPVSLVNALSSVHPFFVLVFALLLSRFRPHILEEKTNLAVVLQKAIAMVLMFIGGAIIS